MQYRAVEPQEYPAFSDLQAQAFFGSRDYEALQSYVEKGGEEHLEARGAFDEAGRLVAGMCLTEFSQQFDGQWVGMGGVGGVCTKPEYRRRGHIRELFKLIFEEMYAKGDVFSYLYPFSIAYYRMFGYEVAPAVNHYEVRLEVLSGRRMSGTSEQFLPELYGDDASDPADYVEIYQAWAGEHNLAVERSGKRWRSLLENDPANTRRRAYLLRNKDDLPIAYVIFLVDGEVLRVTDCAWNCHLGLRDIAAFLGNMAGNIKFLDWSLPVHIVPETLFAEWLDPAPKCKTVGMTRIINVKKALELMRKPASGVVTIDVEDNWIPANDGLFRVDCANNRVEKLEIGQSDMDVSIQALSQMVSGYADLDQAMYRDDVALHSNEELLQALFISKPAMISDHF